MLVALRAPMKAGAMQSQSEAYSRTQSQVQSEGDRKCYVQKKIMSQSASQSHDMPRQCFLRSDPWSLTGGRHPP